MHKRSGILLCTILLVFGCSVVSASQALPIRCSCIYEGTDFYVGDGFATFSQTILMNMETVDDSPGSPAVKMAHIRIKSPILIRGGRRRLAVPAFRPTVTLSAGELKSISFGGPDGRDARDENDMSVDGDYVLDIQFTGDVPKQGAIVLTAIASSSIKAGDKVEFWRTSVGLAELPDLSPAKLHVCLLPPSISREAPVRGWNGRGKEIFDGSFGFQRHREVQF